MMHHPEMDVVVTARDLLAFIDESPTPFHACASASTRLTMEGFAEVDESADWPSGPGHKGFLVRDGSLVAWSVPDDAAPTTPFRIIGAHTDSPNLRVKPRPDVERAGAQLQRRRGIQAAIPKVDKHRHQQQHRPKQQRPL